MKEHYIENRKNLMNKVKGAFVVLYSGYAPVKSGDQRYPFTVDRNFYYLTGIDKEDVVYIGCAQGEWLFINRQDEITAKWTGQLPDKEYYTNLSGIEKIYYADEVDEFLKNREFIGSQNKYADMEMGRRTQLHPKVKHVLNKLPSGNLLDIAEVIWSMRLIKNEFEISSILNAVNLTKEAFSMILRNVRSCTYEYMVESYFDFSIKYNGIKEKAFDTIVAAGENAAVLHYTDNNSAINDGDLILMDFGASYNCYSADITRTFPKSGRFSKRQKELYDIVLLGQQAVMDIIKPGIPFKLLNETLINYYEKVLPLVGLNNGVKHYYYHNVSHTLGLDTHDAGQLKDRLLEENMVITVEPGLYVKEEGIGIRIEDDVLVTKDGYRNLSADIPKKIRDLERLIING